MIKIIVSRDDVDLCSPKTTSRLIVPMCRRTQRHHRRSLKFLSWYRVVSVGKVHCDIRSVNSSDWS